MTSKLFTLGAPFLTRPQLYYSHLPTHQPQFSSNQSAEGNLFTSSLFQSVLLNPYIHVPAALLSTTEIGLDPLIAILEDFGIVLEDYWIHLFATPYD